MTSSQLVLTVAAAFLMIGAVLAVWSSVSLQKTIPEEPEPRGCRKNLVWIAVTAFLVGFLLVLVSALLA